MRAPEKFKYMVEYYDDETVDRNLHWFNGTMPDKFPYVDNEGEVWLDRNHVISLWDCFEIDHTTLNFETRELTEEEVRINDLYLKLNRL